MAEICSCSDSLIESVSEDEEEEETTIFFFFGPLFYFFAKMISIFGEKVTFLVFLLYL